MSVRGFYVSVIDGPQRGLLAGPFVDHESAYALVETVRKWAQTVNERAVWYAFGTASVTSPEWATLPPGMHNEKVETYRAATEQAGAPA